MKTQSILPHAPAAQQDVGEARPSVSLRVLFLIAGLAVVLAAHAPLAVLAARVVS
jgi:hypothetical protein